MKKYGKDDGKVIGPIINMKDNSDKNEEKKDDNASPVGSKSDGEEKSVK